MKGVYGNFYPYSYRTIKTTSYYPVYSDGYDNHIEMDGAGLAGGYRVKMGRHFFADAALGFKVTKINIKIKPTFLGQWDLIDMYFPDNLSTERAFRMLGPGSFLDFCITIGYRFL